MKTLIKATLKFNMVNFISTCKHMGRLITLQTAEVIQQTAHSKTAKSYATVLYKRD